jgi:integrase
MSSPRQRLRPGPPAPDIGWHDVLGRVVGGRRIALPGTPPASDRIEVRGRTVGTGSRAARAPARPAKAKKEVPTLKEFAPQFVDGHARANRHTPSGIAAKEVLLRVHLIPRLGQKCLDGITNEDVQRLKCAMQAKSPKTVNNALAVFSVLLKKAVEWGVNDRMPRTIRLLRGAPNPSPRFHDFDQYERLVDVAAVVDGETRLIVLLGGEAGLRCGEVIALEWTDVDLTKRQVSVQRSDWNGQITTPKGGRIRYVPLTVRLTSALREHRHLRSSRVLCQPDRTPYTRQQLQYRMKCAARRAHVREAARAASHVLLAPAMRGAPGRAIQELAGHSELMDRTTSLAVRQGFEF